MKKLYSKWDKIDAQERLLSKPSPRIQEKTSVQVLNELCQQKRIAPPVYRLIFADKFGVVVEMQFLGEFIEVIATNQKEGKKALSESGLLKLMLL